VRAKRPLAAVIAAETVSSLGSLMTMVALPWFVLETTGSPERMAGVLTAEAAGVVLVGSASPLLVSRLGGRRTLLLCDAVWAPATALIPALHASGGLTFGVLVVLAFVTGMPWAAHYGSQTAVVADVLGEETVPIAQANALLQTLTRATYFAGPVLGGLLLGAFSAATVLAVDAASFACSFLLVAAFVPAPPARVDAESIERIRASRGWRYLTANRWLRRVTTAQALSQGAFMAMSAAIPVLAFSHYERNAHLAGLLLGLWGAGAMVGSIVAFRLVRSLDPSRLAAAAWAAQALPLWAMVISHAPPVAGAALLVSGVANGVRVPPIASLEVARVPVPIRAETMTAATSVRLTGGLAALLVVGPALAALSVGVVWAGIAATQTVAAGLFASTALRQPIESAGGPTVTFSG